LFFLPFIFDSYTVRRKKNESQKQSDTDTADPMINICIKDLKDALHVIPPIVLPLFSLAGIVTGPPHYRG
jgi:hypothetical protein